MNIFTPNLDEQVAQAEAAVQAKDWPAAMRLWEKVIDKLGDDAPYEHWVWLTRSYVNAGELPKAERAAARCLARWSERSSILTLAAKIASANEDWASAVSRWSNVIVKLGDKAPLIAWASLAKAQRLSGKTAEAEETVHACLQKHGESLDIMIEAAELNNVKRAWTAALGAWESALSLLMKQAKQNLTTKAYIRFNISLIKRIVGIAAYKKVVAKHRNPARVRKVAVVTSVTKGYDVIKPPEVLDDRIDYIVYTDGPADDFGIFDIRPLPHPELDNARAIRYVKTHSYELLAEYDIVVWLDASVMIAGDIYPLIDKFQRANKAIGSGRHPLRNNIYEEFEANIKLNKENVEAMRKQINVYKKQGFSHDDLAENTLLMFNNRHPQTAAALSAWWEQIMRFSRRDQLSFNYALAATNTAWFELTRAPEHIRDHPVFIWIPHRSSQAALTELTKLLKG